MVRLDPRFSRSMAYRPQTFGMALSPADQTVVQRAVYRQRLKEIFDRTQTEFFNANRMRVETLCDIFKDIDKYPGLLDPPQGREEAEGEWIRFETATYAANVKQLQNYLSSCLIILIDRYNPNLGRGSRQRVSAENLKLLLSDLRTCTQKVPDLFMASPDVPEAVVFNPDNPYGVDVQRLHQRVGDVLVNIMNRISYSDNQKRIKREDIITILDHPYHFPDKVGEKLKERLEVRN